MAARECLHVVVAPRALQVVYLHAPEGDSERLTADARKEVLRGVEGVVAAARRGDGAEGAAGGRVYVFRAGAWELKYWSVPRVSDYLVTAKFAGHKRYREYSIEKNVLHVVPKRAPPRDDVQPSEEGTAPTTQ